MLVFACAALLLPYVVGRVIEARFRAAIAEATTHNGVSVELERYERHWFDASARTAVIANGRRLEIESQITHGPTLGLDWARIRCWPAKTVWPRIATLFGGQPVVATVTVALAGSVVIRVVSPATSGRFTTAAGDTATLGWGGLNAKASADDGRVRFTLTAPGLRFDTPDLRVVFRDARLTTNGIDPARLDGDDDRHAGARTAIDRLTIDDRQRDSHLTFGLTADASITARDGDLGYSQSIELHAFDIDGPGAPRGAGSLDFDQARLELALEGLRLAPIEWLVADLKTLREQRRASEERGGMAGRPVLEQAALIASAYLPKILSGQPRLSISVPRVHTSRGRFAARLEFALQSLTGDLSALPVSPLAQLRQRARVDAQAFADRCLIEWIAARTGARVSPTLNALLRQNVVTSNNGRIETAFELDTDALRVNGQVLPADTRRMLIERLRQAFEPARANWPSN